MEPITGIGDVLVQRTEYLSPAVLSQYTNQIGILNTIMNYPSGTNYTPTIFDYNNIVAAVQNLSNLAKNGIVEGTPANPITNYLNGSMADNLNLVMQSLKTVGISSNSTQISTSSSQSDINTALEAVQQWQSLNGFGVGQILSAGVQLLVQNSQVSWTDPLLIDPTTGKNVVHTVAYSAENTFQSLLETQYVATGNSVITSQLNSMESALSVTSNLLGFLQIIQNLSNNVQVATDRQTTYTVQGTGSTASIGAKSFSSVFQMPTTGNADTAIAAYSAAANQYFSQLSVVPNGATTPTELYQAKTDLYNSLLQLESVNPQATRSVPNSLAANIFAVVKDISTEFATIPYTPTTTYPTLSAFMNGNSAAFDTAYKQAADTWVIDSQNVKLNVNSTATTSGAFQSNIATAISNSEILNDQQRDNVRSYLLVFEEFYKSAASMLDILTTTIENSAKKAAGN